jgi:hypothetical protein
LQSNEQVIAPPRGIKAMKNRKKNKTNSQVQRFGDRKMVLQEYLSSFEWRRICTVGLLLCILVYSVFISLGSGLLEIGSENFDSLTAVDP